MTDIIEAIRTKVAAGAFEFSEHAVAQTLARAISVQDVRDVIASGSIIEDYPNDKYGPSVLLFGYTSQQRPVHIQCTYPSRPLIKIITAYQPDDQRWIAYRVRRTP